MAQHVDALHQRLGRVFEHRKGSVAVARSGTPEEIVDATCLGAIRLLLEHLEEATDDH